MFKNFSGSLHRRGLDMEKLITTVANFFCRLKIFFDCGNSTNNGIYFSSEEGGPTDAQWRNFFHMLQLAGLWDQSKPELIGEEARSKYAESAEIELYGVWQFDIDNCPATVAFFDHPRYPINEPRIEAIIEWIESRGWENQLVPTGT
jgi:hypothetical protein